MLLVRQLGGGNIWSAVGFVKNELAQLLPVIMGAILVVGASLFVLARFGHVLLVILPKPDGFIPVSYQETSSSLI